jgi:hypothetical protein
VALVSREQPTLDLPAMPEAAVARIVLDDDSWVVKAGEYDILPAAARAWLRVDLGGRPYTFPIGPEHDGVRRADARLPGRKVIRIPGLEEGLRAELVGEDAAIASREEEGEIEVGSAGLATFAVGEQWLELEHPEKGHAVVKLDLPFEAATVEPDCTLTPWPEPAELRVLLDDGTPVAGAYVMALDAERDFPDEPNETDSTGTLRSRSFRDGLHLRIHREDSVFSWAKLSGEPPYEVRLGTAVLEVDCEGLESPACVLDGVAYRAEEAAIVLRGIAAGEHTLVVGANGRKARAYGIVLHQGETRRITFR